MTKIKSEVSVDILNDGWRIVSSSESTAPNSPESSALVSLRYESGTLKIQNCGTRDIALEKETLMKVPKWAHQGELSLMGTVVGGRGCTLYVNDIHAVPFNGTARMPLDASSAHRLKLVVPSHSEVVVNELRVTFSSQQERHAVSWKTDADILVVTPSYPSSANYYSCAFVHSRILGYKEAGLKVDVVCIDPSYWYERKWMHQGIAVYAGNPVDLKSILLHGHTYKSIVVHFVSEPVLTVFDGYALGRRLFFICHGADVACESIANAVRPYFTPALDEAALAETFRTRKEAYRRYAGRQNVTWIFVSEMLHEQAKSVLQCDFKNWQVIPNRIDTNLFVYKEKDAERRKHIFVCRRFELRQYACDLIVLAIMKLSEKPYFKDLTFHIYGDGADYERLGAPIRKFENVCLHRYFVPNTELPQLHEICGIGLFPSRYDSQGVAIAEAAASGLAVIGSKLPCYEGFFDAIADDLFVEQENYLQIVERIDRLYRDPEFFKRMSMLSGQGVRELCSYAKSVGREIALLKKACAEVNNGPLEAMMSGAAAYQSDTQKVLSLIVPAYNVEPYVEKCFFSLLNHSERNQLEIIFVNDGSTDKTLEKARAFERMFPGIVRVVDKENGGHGSAINAGVKLVHGKYFRIIDGDDWVLSENLAEQIRRLRSESADCVLTLGQQEFSDRMETSYHQRYDMLSDGGLYGFEELLLKDYGFADYGPVLSTATLKTDKVRESWIPLDEKRAYVDMEFNVFCTQSIETLRFYDLDIYRYLIGRAGQTVSRDTWKRKWVDHLAVINRIVDFTERSGKLSPTKQRYAREHILWQMIDSQVFMFDVLEMYDRLEQFLLDLEAFPKLSSGAIAYMIRRNSDCKRILNEYQQKLTCRPRARTPYLQRLEALQSDVVAGQKTDAACALFVYDESYANRKSLRFKIKMLLPYGVVRAWQKRRYGF